MMTDAITNPLASLHPLRFNSEWVAQLFAQADKVWVGFSGGVDSHVLLHALATQLSLLQKQKLVVLHVHHGLSVNADHWLKHCELICDHLGVSFVAERVQLKPQASLEDAARNARYEAFQKHMRGRDVILLAHHAGDQVETVLFRLLRGTGGKGLLGIPQARGIGEEDARLIRPLLVISKEDIEDYAQQHQLSWIDDESNGDERFARNFLRHRVVPMLKQRFPKMEQNIASSARRIATDYAMLAQFAQQQLDAWCNEFGGLDLSYIMVKSTDERLFWWRHFLATKNVSLPHAQLESIDRMFASTADKRPEFVFSNGRIMRHQNIIYLLPPDQAVKLSALVSGERLSRPFDSICIIGSDDCELQARPQSESLIMPNGRTRKLKKWLNDQAIPNWWRDHLPYIYQGNTLVAIGNLWFHPDYSHIKVDWQVSKDLPLPK
jgi:tRNA(Ile)-lysidine synthase